MLKRAMRVCMEPFWILLFKHYKNNLLNNFVKPSKKIDKSVSLNFFKLLYF